MLDWLHAHPWMTLAALLLLAGSFRFAIPLPAWRGRSARGKAHDAPAVGVVAPDDVRADMRSPRQRAAKAVAEAIASFREEGNPDAVIVLPYDDIGDKAMIAELLAYQSAGWLVEFHRDHAAIQLPAVVS